MMKKASCCVLAVVPDLRAHKLGPLRAVSAHVRVYAPFVKRAAALLDGLFEHSQWLW